MANENSLSAAIAGSLAEQEEQTKPTKAARKPSTATKPKAKKKAAKKEGGRVLVGGHFHPSVAKQLRIIAAEEETTNQALLEEALDLLFVKKGKAKIESL